MAFALTAYQARSVDIASPSYRQAIQEVVLDITGTTADVDLDIGDNTGTFWTAAQANTTYGALAAKALESIQRIVSQSDALVQVMSQQLLDRIQIATVAGAGEYSLAIQNLRPNIAFNAADGETSYKIILRYELKTGILPEIALYGQSTL